MTSKKKYVLYLVSVINLLIMHYSILLTCRVEEATDAVLWIDNLLGIVIDITVLFSLCLLMTRGRIRHSLFITSIVTLIWSFTNIIYSRFFHHYISLSAISQVGTLADSFMLQNIIEGFKWYDFTFIGLAIACCWLFTSSKNDNYPFKKSFILLIWPFSLIILDLLFHIFICVTTPGLSSLSYYQHRLYVRHIDLLHSSAEPNWASFHRGTIRQLFIPSIYHLLSTKELTKDQIVSIEKEYKDHYNRVSETTNKIKNKNIIFIIVESYLSVTSDLKVNGKEVTPFLNSLKHDSTIYYNGNVTPNIAVGESSDGQFIYMAGLLPLRSDVTVTKAKYAELPGLPRILKQEGLIKESQMIIPTLPSMWEQEGMCKQYGFDNLYSSADYQNGRYWYLSDKQIFEYALEKNRKCETPFLSVILTMTMHQPYTEPKDSTFRINDYSLTEKYRNYLSTCHYTDKQIEAYFQKLKENGLYDNSIIIIVADHHAHPSLFDMNENEISTDIPLYIVNGNINNNSSWQGKCNQLDIYTTLLDIIGTKNIWKGFGHTLITKNYQNSLRPELWNMSEQIIEGNYFKQTSLFTHKD